MTSACHSVSVAGAVVDGQDRILAIRRKDNGHWEPPGGILELNETIEAGLVREVLEETGVRVVPEHLTGVYKNMRRGVIALVFRCHVTSGAIRCGDETTEVAWLTADEVAGRMVETYAVRVLDALRTCPPAIRSHDGTTLTSS